MLTPTGEASAPTEGALDVLVVEDDPAYSAWISGLLRQEARLRGRSVRVVQVLTLAGACEVLETNRMDVVMLDLNLPDSSGLATVSALTRACPSVPIVVVSAIDDENIAMQALSSGAQEYVYKGHEQATRIFRTLNRSIERKLVELQLAVAQQQIKYHERMASIGMLASGVVHEHNNIGAVIMGNVELLLAHPDFPEALRPRAKIILDASQRASAVSRALLAHVRGLRDSEQIIVLQDVVRSTWGLAASTIARYQVSGMTSLAPEPLTVRGNASLLGQVLLNLIINACHAMDGCPQRHVQVAVYAAADGTGAMMSVTDSGSGIAEADLPHIFEPFFTTKASLRTSSGPTLTGSGLGLAMCRSFVTQHGGTIAVESRVGHGTTFTMWLPTANREVAATSIEVLPPIALEVEGRRALIIVDETVEREFLELALRDLGMVTLTTAYSGLTQTLTAEMSPDLVVVNWPHAEGFGRALVERLRKLIPDHRLAILVLASTVVLEDSEWLSGMDDVRMVLKPIALHDLQEAARLLLAKHPGSTARGSTTRNDAL